MRYFRFILFFCVAQFSYADTSPPSIRLSDMNNCIGNRAKDILSYSNIRDYILLDNPKDSFYWPDNRNIKSLNQFQSMLQTGCISSFEVFGSLPKKVPYSMYNFYIINKISVDLVAQIKNFTPRKKDQFEKTSDYQDAIKQDKDQYLAKFGKISVDMPLYSYVWNTLMTNPVIRGNNLKPVYDADNEALKVNIGPNGGFKFYIPISIKMSPDDAKKLSKSFDEIGIFALNKVSLHIFYTDGKFIVKSVSLEPTYDFRNQEYNALGINFRDIPVDYQIDFMIGNSTNTSFEAMLPK